MDELIFDIIADENAEMIQEINSIVNEAIRVLIARGMYDAGVTVKIHVSLESAGQEDGSRLLIGWADDIAEAGMMMDEDRRNEDYDIRYDVIKDQDKE